MDSIGFSPSVNWIVKRVASVEKDGALFHTHRSPAIRFAPHLIGNPGER